MVQEAKSPAMTEPKVANDSSVQKDPESKEEDGESDTYLHGLKLVLVFIGLALGMFVIVLDQTVRRIRICDEADFDCRSSSQPSQSSPHPSTLSIRSVGSAREWFLVSA